MIRNLITYILYIDDIYAMQSHTTCILNPSFDDILGQIKKLEYMLKNVSYKLKSIQLERNTVKMSGGDIAKSGFNAEEVFRNDKDIKKSLENYFKKSIHKIEKAPHGKKYDNIIIFHDRSQVNIQNKKIIKLGGRGPSFDRRHLDKTFQNQQLRENLKKLTLSRPTKCSTIMTNDEKKNFISLCNNHIQDIQLYLVNALMGEDKENDYWCFMKTNKDLSKNQLYIISSDKFVKFLEDSIHINIKFKNNGTCLHINKYVSLQRKGGGRTDHSPNDIQAKLKITQDILDICTHIL